MAMTQPKFAYTTGTRTRGDTAPEGLRGTTVATYKILMNGHAVVHGTGSEQDAKNALADMVDRHTPTVVTFADGTTATLAKQTAENVVGLSADGYVVVESGSMKFGLTPCCFTSATGTEDGIACRSCYTEVDWSLGGNMDVAVPVQATGVPSPHVPPGIAPTR